MTTVFEVLHKKAEPYKITLNRGQNGTYGWEITVSACTVQVGLEMLKDADKHIRNVFDGGKNEQHN